MSIIRPTIRVLGLVALSLSSATNLTFAQEAVGYSTVGEARRAVASLPGATSSEQSGWLIVEVKATQTMWSFPPERHAAYPAVVKRTVVEREGRLSVDMDILCEAAKFACDRLNDSFKALNERMVRSYDADR